VAKPYEPPAHPPKPYKRKKPIYVRPKKAYKANSKPYKPYKKPYYAPKYLPKALPAAPAPVLSPVPTSPPVIRTSQLPPLGASATTTTSVVSAGSPTTLRPVPAVPDAVLPHEEIVYKPKKDPYREKLLKDRRGNV